MEREAFMTAVAVKFRGGNGALLFRSEEQALAAIRTLLRKRLMETSQDGKARLLHVDLTAIRLERHHWDQLPDIGEEMA